MSIEATSAVDRGRAPRRMAMVAVYLRPRVLIVALFGFSAGLPLALSAETLRVWMADRGVDLGTIGLLSLAGLPYTIKFCWAPIVDALDVPWLSRRLGRRRGWLLASQLCLMAAIVFLATRDPLASAALVAVAAVLVALASATQDILIDAWRVESLALDEQAAGVASYVAAYRIGMLAASAGVIALTAWLQALGCDTARAWTIAYMIGAALIAIGLCATLLAPEPAGGRNPASPQAPALSRVYHAATGAVAEFLLRDAALGTLAFVMVFKLSDALAGAMTAPFVLSLGYDKATYAAIVKGVGLAALLLGGFAGGAVAKVVPLPLALWLAAILQTTSNLAFVWLGMQTPSLWALTVSIMFENFTSAIGPVIFVAYLSALCRDRQHTATQYALLTALASTGRTVVASGTGFMAQALGWPAFFVATALAALPALALLAWLQRQGHFRTLAADRDLQP